MIASAEGAEVSAAAAAPSPRHLPALDGLRGAAVLLVVICHLSEQFQPWNAATFWLKTFTFAGWTGVDLFFVLSGFLITGILWDAKGSNAYFRNFYARRTVRIFPLYYVTVGLLFLLAPLAAGPLAGNRMFGELLQSRRHWVWFCTYMMDVFIAWKGFLFPGHFWSLAVEEHFYLVWPVIVCRCARRTLVPISLALIAAPLALRAVLSVCNVTPTAIYVLTPCRIDGLALGAWIALTLRTPGGLRKMERAASAILPLSATLWLMLLLLQGGWSQYGFLAQTLGYPVTEVFYACVLVLALASAKFGTAISIAPLRLLGKVSYGVYVLHVFPVLLSARFFALGNPVHSSIVFSLVRHLSGSAVTPGAGLLLLDGTCYIVLALILSIGTALVSWYVLELPCLRLKRLFPYGGPG